MNKQNNNKIKKGQVFKNYKELCACLGESEQKC